jgi:adenine phosphoribosyltransferase
MDLKKFIFDVPDFPKKGIVFRDVTPLLKDAAAFRETIDILSKEIKNSGNTDYIAGIDARGFIFSAAVAYSMDRGLVIARKKGKLPRESVSRDYALEYASQALEIHKDSVKKGQKIAIVDDVLATGGTALAAAELIKSLGGEVSKIVFLIELKDLKGREKLKKYEVFSLLEY